MIPFTYRLRRRVRIEEQNGAGVVISEIPLNVIRVSLRAARMLRLSDGTRSVGEVADETGASEEQTHALCQYFLRRGVLEIEPAKAGAFTPSVTIIIPVRDRKEELAQCLASVFAQDYPEDKREVIVIDDGSIDGSADLARTFPCAVLSHKKSRGQSYCRNLGARSARGEILAFIDSDCVAKESWLKELVPYFQWERIAAVGGFVDGYYEESALDRYEKTCSPLNMGKRVLFGANDDSTFYTPTCNLLVRAGAYGETGGITESLHVGEDVDLCWRLRNRGYHLLYVPAGTVRHKHRNHLPGMLKRRADYGTSEALLYTLHGEKKKVFQLPPFSALSFLSFSLALLFLSPLFLIPMGISLVLEGIVKTGRVRKMKLGISGWKALFSVGRSHFSFFYFISFHLVRYYLIALILLGFAFPPFFLFSLFLALLSSSVDYMTKRPALMYPSFFFFSTLDHISYQAGVCAGCVKAGTFRSYGARILKKMPVGP
jgi:mycofactocin glycosyltransferase